MKKHEDIMIENFSIIEESDHSVKVDSIGNTYMFKSNGEVFSIYSCGKVKQLKPYISSSGYKVLSLSSNKKRLRLYVHRIMSIYFLDMDIKSDLCVNHKNGVKLDNNVGNLEVVTRSINNKHAYDTGLKKSLRGRAFNGSKGYNLNIHGSYVVNPWINGRTMYVKSCKTEKEAIELVAKVREEHGVIYGKP